MTHLTNILGKLYSTWQRSSANKSLINYQRWRQGLTIVRIRAVKHFGRDNAQERELRDLPAHTTPGQYQQNVRQDLGKFTE
jgi:hypothetical protein